jgi:hypothetical protein
VVALGFVSFLGHISSIGFGHGSSLDSSTVLFDIFSLVLDLFVVLSLYIELVFESLETDILERCTKEVSSHLTSIIPGGLVVEKMTVSSTCEETGSVLACHKSCTCSSDCHKF